MLVQEKKAAAGLIVKPVGAIDGRGLSLAYTRPRVYASSQLFNVNTVQAPRRGLSLAYTRPRVYASSQLC
jgi:hypothetical protein